MIVKGSIVHDDEGGLMQLFHQALLNRSIHVSTSAAVHEPSKSMGANPSFFCPLAVVRLCHDKISPALAFACDKAKDFVSFLHPSCITVTRGIKARFIHVNQLLEAEHPMLGSEFLKKFLPSHIAPLFFFTIFNILSARLIELV
ncbi:hypothetical protein [Nitrosococcus watsonii]|uniref:hypothetical protein n=1 Tax=Nitrosococcus watsonii TaxID=473531 RepID=UPI001E63A50C|nr:hypothetical protein [Nitrosococcus watsonii]